MTEPTGDSSPIDYRNPLHARPTKPRITVLRSVVWTSVAIVVVLSVIGMSLSGRGRAGETANRIKCASNLRQIGMAIVLYANDNRGQLPPDFGALLETQDITSEVFICASDDRSRAQGATTQQIIIEMLSGDHLSYGYAGGQHISSLTLDMILAFDLEQHSPKDAGGITILLGDGSTKFVNEKVAEAIKARFNAGVRPIRLSDCDPTMRPTTNPAGTGK